MCIRDRLSSFHALVLNKQTIKRLTSRLLVRDLPHLVSFLARSGRLTSEKRRDLPACSYYASACDVRKAGQTALYISVRRHWPASDVIRRGASRLPALSLVSRLINGVTVLYLSAAFGHVTDSGHHAVRYCTVRFGVRCNRKEYFWQPLSRWGDNRLVAIFVDGIVMSRLTTR